MTRRRLIRLSLKDQQAIAGYIFVLPFVIGFVFFFLYPFIQAIQFSLSDLKVTPTGYTLTYLGLENYRKALFVHPTFVRNLVGVLGKMCLEVPVIVAFSFFRRGAAEPELPRQNAGAGHLLFCRSFWDLASSYASSSGI